MCLRREWSNTGDRRETALAGRVGHCPDLLGVSSIFCLTSSIFVLILKLLHLSIGQKVRLLGKLRAEWPKGVQKYPAVGSSGCALSRAASPPAVDLNGGCEQAPKGTAGLPEPEDIFLVS